jgi:glycosyltransferase involved in cell wall biosynthesis
LRDFNTLVGIIKLLNQNMKAHFDVVYPYTIDDRHTLFQLLQFSNIGWHRNIDDLDLKNLYLNADFLLLPLFNSTANNVLLEAASCGLPIITSNCGGVNDYFSKDMLLLPEVNTSESFCELIIGYKNRANKIKTDLVQTHVQSNFNWKEIALRTTRLYQSL